MTDTPRSPDDELVSAHLDGETTAAERGLVEQDLAATRRLQAFTRVHDELAAPVAVPPAAREAAVAAALAAFTAETPARAPDAAGDDQLSSTMPAWITDPTTDAAAGAAGGAAGDERAPAGSGVVSMADRRRPPRAVGLLSVAAAIMVLLGIGVVIRTAVQRSNDATISQTAGQAVGASTTAPTDRSADAAAPNQPEVESSKTGQPNTTTGPPTSIAPPAASTAPGSAAAGAPAPADQGSTTSAPPAASNGVVVVDLGPVADAAALRRGVAGALGADAPPTTPGLAPTDPRIAALDACDSGLRSQDPEITSPRLRATATFAGTPAFVIVYDVDQARFPAANGPLRIYTVDAGSCRVLDVQTL